MQRVNASRCSMTGFTLVELVITLVLVGILSALGVGLLVSPSSYSAGAARDQFVSSALLAQKRALANSGSGESTVLRVRQIGAGGDWVFEVSEEGADCGEQPEDCFIRSAEREDATLTIDDTALTDGSSRGFEFNSKGHLASGDNVDLTFEGPSTHNACISSLGFTYPETCQP